ncbi:RES domain-containing protein [Massilia glaciei]|uniref:RES domain-containing protein n=1 Tax=Massilia glaciei TaxID=1524097 RepID=A0A2U2HJC5_9BURK|nr:RES domain-containing protein [Massilia glaciei]PWF47610.1 RES domain-containing protein [Massilia glaciei]
MLASHPPLTPPKDIARRLPDPALLQRTLRNNIVVLPTGSTLARAAWNPASVLPAQVNTTYRFGPPAQSRAADGSFPFHWIYAAHMPMTAVWEAGLCLNDVTRPGSFYVAPGAPEALIVTFGLRAPLVLFDANGLVLSKLGIFDEVSSPDHAWSQWFGCMVDALVAAEDGRVHGFRYPSRKHCGHEALALSSRELAMLRANLSVTKQAFGATPEYKVLLEDLCRVPPP